MKTKQPFQFIVFIMGLLMLLNIQQLCGQNDPVISQQGLQRFIYNPAATGTSNSFQCGLINRNQWNGFPDAPVTRMLTAHTFIPKFKVGVGLVVVMDKLGLEENLQFKTAYSYHVWLNENNILSFGVSAGIFSKNFKLDQLVLEEQNDLGVNQLENVLVPDFDFGIELNRKRTTFGVSATHIFKSQMQSDNMQHPRHLHAYAHYKQPLTENILIRGISSYYNIGNIHGFELTVIGEIENTLWFGASKRFGESYVFLGGVNITNQIKVGYSYDLVLNPMKNYNSGSHEVFVHLKFDQKSAKSKSPRFFN